jgi:hypothetical protein
LQAVHVLLLLLRGYFLLGSNKKQTSQAAPPFACSLASERLQRKQAMPVYLQHKAVKEHIDGEDENKKL